MGAIAEAIVAYARPLLDQTGGSEMQINNAFAMSQLCYNLALLPDDVQEKHINELQVRLKMDNEEFAAFRRGIIVPMIRRHKEMFPLMHQQRAMQLAVGGASRQSLASPAGRAEKFPGTDRYAPCPCNRPKIQVLLRGEGRDRQKGLIRHAQQISARFFEKRASHRILRVFENLLR